MTAILRFGKLRGLVDGYQLGVLVGHHGNSHALLVRIETHSFLLPWPILIYHCFLIFLLILRSLLIRKLANLIPQQYRQDSLSFMWKDLKQDVCDILQDVVFDGLDSSGMIFEEIVQIEYFILEKYVISAVLFTLDYPLMERLFFHLFSKNRRRKNNKTK